MFISNYPNYFARGKSLNIIFQYSLTIYEESKQHTGKH